MEESAIGREIRRLRSWLPWRRKAAAWALSRTADARAVEPLVRALADRNRGVRCAAARALEAVGDYRAIPALARLLAHADRETRQAAAWALAGSESVQEAVRLLQGFLQMGAEPAAPATHGPVAAVPAHGHGLLCRQCPDEARAKKFTSAALVVLEEERTRLLRRLRGFNGRTEAAIAVLQDLDDERAVDPLVRLLCDQERVRWGKVCQKAEEALLALAPGREKHLARAALDYSLQVDVRLSVRRFRRLVRGEPEYTLGSEEVRDILCARGRWGVQGLLAACHVQDIRERRAVANSVADWGVEEVVAAVLSSLEDPDGEARQTLRALWQESPAFWQEITEHLSGALAAGEHSWMNLVTAAECWVSLWVAAALGISGQKDAVAWAASRLSSARDTERLAAAVLLAYRGEAASAGALLPALQRRDPLVRLIAAGALARLGGAASGALPRLRELAAGEANPEIRQVYRKAAQTIRGALSHVSRELIAAPHLEGTGVEMEAGYSPEGTGTEPEAVSAPERAC